MAMRTSGAFGRPVQACGLFVARVLAVGLGVSAQQAHPQARELPKSATCASCRIVLERIATLGSGDSGFVRSEPIWMSRDSRGRIYVTWQNYGHGPELAVVYDSAGNFLQELGRKGQGPGEFHYPVTVNVDRNDRLLVWDSDRRATLLDNRYRFVRQHIQGAATVLVLPTGHQLLGLPAADRDNVAAPLSLLDSSGAFVRGIGATREAYADSGAWRADRIVGFGAASTVWVARPDYYRLEQWDLSGRLVRAFARRPEWFANPTVSRRTGHYGDAPTPVPKAIREDGEGRLWYLVSVSAVDWKTALGKPRTTPGRPVTYPERNRSGVYDTMIDVIDVRTGTLLASRRVPDYVQFLLADDLAASYRQEADGTPLIDIWRMRLTTK